jgi:homoserine dehydrogenase
MQRCPIGLIGWGTVGGGVVEILQRDPHLLRERCGLDIHLKTIVTKRPGRTRSQSPGTATVTDRLETLLSDREIGTVIHLVGGTSVAKDICIACLEAGKHVVTANKALLAEHGDELFGLAARRGVSIAFEAAVAGGIPIIAALRDGLVANRIDAIYAILNGTCNYILTRMEEEGAGYDDVLREAQELGLAEKDPTADVDGHDAAAKAAILAALAFGSDVVDADVYREGISGISAADVAYASRLGYSVKLLAIAELIDGGPEMSVRVHPAMVPKTHPLASVRGAFNAVFVEGAVSGELMLYGRGAGGGPTASAMLGDLVDASRNLLAGAPAPAPKRTSMKVFSQSDMRSAFYLSLDVADRPGVLAAVAKIFGDHDVSIRAMEQVGLAEEARLIFLTHVAREGDLLATIDELRRYQAVDRVSGVLRVIGERDDDGGGLS